MKMTYLPTLTNASPCHCHCQGPTVPTTLSVATTGRSFRFQWRGFQYALSSNTPNYHIIADVHVGAFASRGENKFAPGANATTGYMSKYGGTLRIRRRFVSVNAQRTRRYSLHVIFALAHCAVDCKTIYSWTVVDWIRSSQSLIRQIEALTSKDSY